jgi:hypothetical protein
MPTAEIAALIATVLAVAGALSQLRRLARTGDPAGVSLANAMLGTVTELGWLAYTLHESLWSAVPEVGLMLGANLLLACILVRAGLVVVRPFAASVAWGVVLASGTALGGWALLGAMLPIAYALQVAPSVWSAFRTWAPTGVATATWTLILIESVLWGVFGLIEHDPALTMFGVIGGTASSSIVVRMLITRDRVCAVRREEGVPWSVDGTPPARVQEASSATVSGARRGELQRPARRWIRPGRASPDRPSRLISASIRRRHRRQRGLLSPTRARLRWAGTPRR